MARFPTTESRHWRPRWRAATARTSASPCAARTSTSTGTGRLAPRLCQSGVPAEIVFGEDDEVGLTPDERSTLDSCPTTRLHFVPDAGHMLLNQNLEWVAELIVQTVAA